MGLSYECKVCLSERKKGRDRRKERWSNLTPEGKEKAIARQFKYNRSIKGRAVFLASAYRQIDKAKGQVCDIDYRYMLKHVFTGKCVYCGTTEQLGCDRLNNALGHTKANTVPACRDCNIMRGDRFTHEEMLVIGIAVAAVKAARPTGNLPMVVANEAHL
jgi:hypothetical protein